MILYPQYINFFLLLWVNCFSSSIRLLHKDLRTPVFNIYGFVRFADEIVDSFHDFDKETPAKGYFLIGENEMEKVLSTYGDKYTFRTLTKSDQTFSELKQKIVLSEFELK